MPVPFLSSITLNKNEVQDFKVFNVGTGNPTLSSGGDIGYFWTDTTGSKVLKWWDGSAVRTLLDSSSTTIVAADLSGGAAGSLPYQQGASDTTFLGIGTAGQVLTVASGAPAWTSQSNLSVGSATWLNGGAQGDIPVQSAAGTTGFLNIGANGRILTSNGTTPVWSASIPASSVSGLAASATTDTTNASNISSGTLGLARLSLATDQFYVGDASNNPAATAKSSIRLSGFGTPNADVAMGGFKITGLGTPTASTDAANKDYVDGVAQGLDVKASCKAATVSNINLASPGATIDTVSLSVDNRVLVKDQSLPAENGIYLWKGAAVAMVRSPDADTWDELVGAFTFVEEGTTANADSGWVCTVNAGGTLGTTAVTWTKFSQAGSYTAGNGMVLSGGVFHFAQSSAYTAGQIPFCSNSPTANSIGFSSNLFWDNSNNRLGIGTATPSESLDVNGAIYVRGANALKLDNASNNYVAQIKNTGASGQSSLEFLLGSPYGTKMTLDHSGKLGIGTTTPNYKLHILNDGGSAHAVRIYDTGANASYLALNASNTDTGIIAGGSSAVPINFYTGGTLRATLSADGNVGIGTATPNRKLEVAAGTSGAALRLTNTNGNSGIEILTASDKTSWRIGAQYNVDQAFEITPSTAVGGTTFSTPAVVVTSSGNLGIGTATPSSFTGNLKVAIGTGSGVAGLTLYGGNATFSGLYFADGTTGNETYRGYLEYDHATDSFAVGTAGANKMFLTSGGNLGLGVTPSAWVGGYKAFQSGRASFTNDGGATTFLTHNWYWSGSANTFIANDFATRYLQTQGKHIWSTSTTSGTAGNPVTFTDSMVLDASGNLLVGTAVASDRLNIAGGIDLSGATTGQNIRFTNSGTNGTPRLAAQLTYRSSSYSGAVFIASYITGAFDDSNDLRFYTGGGNERLRIKSTGQVNFVGQASDPAGAAGDVVYNSTSNRLKYHNGTAWVDSGTRKVSVVGGAGTGTYIDATHNFNTKTVSVTVLRTTDNVVVYTDVAMTNDNTVRVTFASSVTLADYTVTVIG